MGLSDLLNSMRVFSKLGPEREKPEKPSIQAFDASKPIPSHIAIIMDGNGRWAKRRGLPREFGHRRGVEKVKDIVKVCGKIGIRYLTLYAFSTENWRRPRTEVNTLMNVFEDTIKNETASLLANNVKVKIIGSRDGLGPSLLQAISHIEEATRNATGLNLFIAFNYGGRREIADAMRSVGKKLLDGELRLESITEETIQEHLYTAGVPDPDLVIRTSGEMRISNFMIWQVAYSEFLVTDVLWPDFSEKDLFAAIRLYQTRKRRFGGLSNSDE